jgi:hypothetical protein
MPLLGRSIVPIKFIRSFCQDVQMRLRRVPWWAWFAGSIVTMVALVTIFVASVALDTANSDHVSFVNDGTQTVRLGGCQIDDALDLAPGQVSSELDVATTEGCAVYATDVSGSPFIGCVVLRRGSPQSRVVRVMQSLSRQTSRRACDAIS